MGEGSRYEDGSAVEAGVGRGTIIGGNSESPHSDSPASTTKKNSAEDIPTNSKENGSSCETSTMKDPAPSAPPQGISLEASRTKLQTVTIMLSLCAALFLAALDTTIVTTALPSICEHFNSDEGYTCIRSAYLLANAASTPSWGIFSDIWGRKAILLLGLGILFVGSLLAATSVSIGMLIVARTVQGIGGGEIFVLVSILRE
ncbi:hypothetical protein EPUS_04703 [Endocarpon pusillum Z07020]|uniref:Major facilitator superfamily (MFS) profile domain-containing protein n=1 Tax=Endocarpon pusillum (strain Z07020 / HMAS-L-300199) TaxID=1263415 RepID=U1HJK8_ENDPU|nr:uncharacterized protein EPUS_04703 [Endocarpon pusillum Z07020]ERF70425.1 hypothetical protein EPUS_04703 [Endocarpon pusillum Z07020]